MHSRASITHHTGRVACFDSKFHPLDPLIEPETARPHAPGGASLKVAVRFRFFRAPAFLALLLILGAARVIHAASPPTATAQFTDTSLGGGEFDYQITLMNTGTTTIGTFWNAWVPGKDFMAVSPTNIISPTNWSAAITNGGGSDGFAIQWTTSTADLQPDNSLQFSFESTVNPSAMEGDSTFYPTTPVETSFAYSGAPFSDSGDEFVVQPAASVPEPGSWALGSAGALCVFAAAMRRRRSRAA